MTKTLRLIGDVHGAYHLFFPLTHDTDYVLQVGDLGLDYKPFAGIDPVRIRCLAGNHDVYQQDSIHYFKKQPFFLGDYGTHQFHPSIPPIFYVRGAWSIDHAWRQKNAARGGPVNWWEEEELSTGQLEAAIEAYAAAKPQIVVTHEAPISLVEHVTDPRFPEMFGYPPGVIETRTSLALQRMLDEHRPEIWLWGHYHRRWEATTDGTRFVCLDMLGREPSKASGAWIDLAF